MTSNQGAALLAIWDVAVLRWRQMIESEQTWRWGELPMYGHRETDAYVVVAVEWRRISHLDSPAAVAAGR